MVKDLCPEEDTLNQWEDSKRTEEDWKRYRVKLLPQMKKSEAANKIKELRHRSKNGEIITLLCYCESGEHCHTYIVKSLIEVRLQIVMIEEMQKYFLLENALRKCLLQIRDN